MKNPPLLLGAALLFWGWQTDTLVAGAIMAVILESALVVKARWKFSNQDFARLWTFCALLLMAIGAYAFTSTGGPASLGGWGGGGAAANLGRVSATTTVRIIRLLPLAFFLFVAAQTFSDRGGIPLETISLILQRRWRDAKKSGQPPPESRPVNVAYPYFAVCLFAASAHPPAERDSYFWGFCVLLIWALWGRRSPRFSPLVWACLILTAVGAGYAGQRGLVQLKLALEQYNPGWLGGWRNRGTDATESRTEIGRIGRIKNSAQIVIRLEVPPGKSPPPYLREVGFRSYSSAIWYAGGAKDDFVPITESPPNSENWPLLPAKINADTVNIACYLPDGRGLLPLPTGVGRLEQLPAFELQMNSSGAVRASGPGLVIFNALYGPGATIDQPPGPEDDLAVPEKEKPALDKIITELQLAGADRKKAVETVTSFFATKFTYSLRQAPPKVKSTNSTALSRFLLSSRKGHCEYFATATVLLLRELGFPARYAVGYAVHEAHGNEYLVRLSDAHAWCRLWNPKHRNWEDLDTTPGIWLDDERQRQSRLQFISDAWSRVVFEFSKFRWGQSNVRRYIWWALVPALAFLLYQLIFRGDRKRVITKSSAYGLGPVWPGLDSDLYKLEARLAQRGLVRALNEPMSLWLTRLAAEPEFVDLKEALPRMTRLHYRHRFDPVGLNPQDREALRGDVAVCLARLETAR